MHVTIIATGFATVRLGMALTKGNVAVRAAVELSMRWGPGLGRLFQILTAFRPAHPRLIRSRWVLQQGFRDERKPSTSFIPDPTPARAPPRGGGLGGFGRGFLG